MITFINDFRLLTVSYSYVRNKWSKTIFPKLTLSGNWMKEAGFEVGCKVSIQVNDKNIIITKIEGNA